MDMARGLLEVAAADDAELAAFFKELLARLTMWVVGLLVLMEAEVGTTKASEDELFTLGRPCVKTSWSLELTIVAPAVMLLGGGIGAGGGGGGGGGGGKDGPGDMDRIGESSSVSKSKMLSSREGSSLVPRSLEKPEATSSSC